MSAGRLSERISQEHEQTMGEVVEVGVEVVVTDGVGNGGEETIEMGAGIEEAAAVAVVVVAARDVRYCDNATQPSIHPST